MMLGILGVLATAMLSTAVGQPSLATDASVQQTNMATLTSASISSTKIFYDKSDTDDANVAGYPNSSVASTSRIIDLRFEGGYDVCHNGTCINSVIYLQQTNGNNTTTLPADDDLLRSGYDLVGWNTRADGTGTSYRAGQKISVDDAWVRSIGEGKSADLYAQWRSDPSRRYCTITYMNSPEDANKGSAYTFRTDMSEAACPYTTTIDNSAAEPYAGHTYTNTWNTALDGSGTTYRAGQSATFTSNTTLYPMYAVNKSVTLTFSANGGTGTDPTPITAPAGSVVSLPDKCPYTRDHYTFEGWGLTPRASGHESTITMPTTDTTIYAVWYHNFSDTASFDGNGGTGVAPASITADDGSHITMPQNTFTKKGYRFVGWSVSKTGMSPTFYQGGDSVLMVAGDRTYYAQWEVSDEDKIFTVMFDANGGYGSVNSETGTKSTKFAIPAGSGFSHDGYTFAGWNTRADGTGKSYGEGDSYTIEGNATIYAQWTKRTAPSTPEYELSFDANGGLGTMKPIVSGTSKSIALPRNTYTRAGYQFFGWNTRQDNTGRSYRDGETMVLNADTTLYAQWASGSASSSGSSSLSGGGNDSSGSSSSSSDSKGGNGSSSGSNKSNGGTGASGGANDGSAPVAPLKNGSAEMATLNDNKNFPTIENQLVFEHHLTDRGKLLMVGGVSMLVLLIVIIVTYFIRRTFREDDAGDNYGKM